MKKIILMLLMLCCLGPMPRGQAAMIGKQEEINMGRDVGQQLEAQYGVVQDEDMQARIDRIGQSLVKQCARQDLKYSFKVLNSDEINAMACPGGFIYVFKGLLDYMPSDDELAGVLGHEIGHVVKRHTVHQVEKQLTLSLLTLIAGAAAGDPGAGIALATTASSALMAGYSRADEGQADTQGIELTTKAGYNPYALYVTMCKLNDLAKEKGNPGYGLFDSHPQPELRMKRALQEIAPLHISAKVTLHKDGSATVQDGNWQFSFLKTVGSDKPEYRARMLAGALYLVKKHKPVDESHFITVDGDGYSDIYYEDIKIMRLYTIDNLSAPTLSDYAGQVAGLLQQWAKDANKIAG